MAFWSSLIPGQTLAVFYEDDDVYHERILLWRHSGGHWFVLTPDGDRYTEDVRASYGTISSSPELSLGRSLDMTPLGCPLR